MPYLKAINLPDARPYLLTGEVSVLGRAAEADIIISGEGISRRHAEIRRTPDGWTITDLSSRNGTFVNNAQIAQTTALAPGDHIRLGAILLVVMDEATEPVHASVVVHSDDQGLPASMYPADRLPYAAAGHHDQGAYEEHHDFLLKLTQLSREVMGAESEQALGDFITERLRGWFGADCCAVVYPRNTADGCDLTIQAISCEKTEGSRDLTISRTALRQALENKMASITTNALQDDRFMAQKSVVERRLVSILCAPLWHEEHIFGLLYVDSSDTAAALGIDHLGFVSAVANLTAIKIDNLRLFRTAIEKSALDKELSLAGRIQTKLLPDEPFSHAGLFCVGSHQACASVGGDYYDFIPLGDHTLTVAIADVAGHGPSSALLMVACKTMLTTLIDAGMPIEERVRRLNRYMMAYSANNQFITFFHAEIDPVAGLLRYCNAGHNPPMLLTPDGNLRLLAPSGPPIGIAELPYIVDEEHFEPGARLVMYTDGITEMSNADGELYEETRLITLVLSQQGQRATGLKHAILEAVSQFAGGAPPHDDVTLAIVEYGVM